MKRSDEIVLDGVVYVRKEEAKERVALEFWIDIHQEGKILRNKPLGNEQEQYFIHVREVMPGEVVVTKESLLKAMNGINDGYVEMITHQYFSRVCKALGLNDE